MRKLLNRLLAPTGYRIERVSRLQRELQLLLHRPSRRLKFVQIGAHDGISFDGLYGFVTQHQCSGIVVEPLPDLFERLRIFRRRKADERGVPPFIIFSDATLRDLARVRPTRLDHLPTIHGIGTKKLADYGAELLVEIKDYVGPQPNV